MAQAPADPTVLRRAAVDLEEVGLERLRSAARALDVDPHRGRFGEDPVPGCDRGPALGPARPDPAAERRQLHLVVVPGQRPHLDRESPHDPDAFVLVEPGVVGVVGGDVLQVAGQRLQPQLGVAPDVAEMHAARRCGTHGRPVDGLRTPRPPGAPLVLTVPLLAVGAARPASRPTSRPCIVSRPILAVGQLRASRRGCAASKPRAGPGTHWASTGEARCRGGSTVLVEERYGVAGGSSRRG